MLTLAASADTAALDPAFGPAPEDEVQRHLSRHLQTPGEVCMQLVYRRDGGPFLGFWRLVRVPSRPQALGVEILWLDPAHRRQGLAREWVAGALEHLRGVASELWARVYLANAPALSFWMQAGLCRVVRHQGEFIHGLDGPGPHSLILCTDIPPLEPDPTGVPPA